ncbi:hypothetical protein [Nocardia sp. NPDC004604]|uniref:hypothetical protein n=1 Tax=Nocardia sp. NPDC004604 TaxID=3157013 RepID=UPI0033B2E570
MNIARGGEVAVLPLVNDGSELSPAEQRLAEWIEWSPAQPGVALLDVEVPTVTVVASSTR